MEYAGEGRPRALQPVVQAFAKARRGGVRRLAPAVLSEGLTVRVLPLRRDAPIYLPKDRWPGFDGTGQVAAIRAVTATPEYEIPVTVNTTR